MEAIQYVIDNAGKLWTLTYQHLWMSLIATVLAVALGAALGLVVTAEGRERMGRIILSLAAAAQAVPAIAVIALVFIFVGIGPQPAVIALVIYSLVPVVFNVTSGILSVPSNVIDAARGIGFTDTEILVKVKIPIAMPVIMAGVRSAATISIGTATVATVIGAGGLGDLIMTGLKVNRMDMIVIGASLAAILAIGVDALLATLESRVTPKGLARTRS